MKFTKENITDTLTVSQLVELHNRYCEENNYGDDMIYEFNEENINEFIPDPWDALCNSYYGNVNMSDDWFRFNGYGNIETIANGDVEDEIDLNSMAEWLKENEDVANEFGIEGEENEEEE